MATSGCGQYSSSIVVVSMLILVAKLRVNFHRLIPLGRCGPSFGEPDITFPPPPPPAADLSP